MRIETREQLQAIRKEAKAKIDATPIRILICAGTGCISGGSQFIYDKMKELVGDNENVEVKFEGHVPHPEVKKSTFNSPDEAASIYGDMFYTLCKSST